MICESCDGECLWFENIDGEDLSGYQCSMCGAVYNEDGDLIEEGYHD